MKLAITLAVVATMACTQVNSGTVISKEYNPSYTTFNSQCMAYDKNGSCMSSILVPYTYPEEFWLCLRDDTETGKPVKDRDTGCVEVDEGTYGQYHSGEHYP